MDIVVGQGVERAGRFRWRTVVARVSVWLSVWSERRSLASLDARMLADIGVNEGAALAEAQRRMWDLPRNRDFGGGREFYR